MSYCQILSVKTCYTTLFYSSYDLKPKKMEGKIRNAKVFPWHFIS